MTTDLRLRTAHVRGSFECVVSLARLACDIALIRLDYPDIE